MPQIELATISGYIGPILPFVVLVALGLTLKLTHVLKESATEPFNKLIMGVTLPAMIFVAVYQAELSLDMLKGVIAGWILLPIITLAAWALCKILRLSRPTTGAVILCAAFGNTGFLGYPLTGALFGQEAVAQSVFYDLGVTVAPVFTIGVVIAARFGGGEGKAKAKPLQTLAKTPTMWALVLALLAKLVVLPDSLVSIIDLLSQITVPLIMISIGLSLSPKKFLGNIPALLVAVALCLIAAPLIALVLVRALGANPYLAQITVLEASMPTAMLVLGIVQRYRLDTHLTATIIFAAIILSVFTIPLVQILAFA